MTLNFSIPFYQGAIRRLDINMLMRFLDTNLIIAKKSRRDILARKYPVELYFDIYILLQFIHLIYTD